MKNFQLLSICLLTCFATILTACSDDDEPSTDSQRPDLSVSFFEEGNNTPIKETKFYLPAYNDSISDLSSTTSIHYKITNCTNEHNHSDITVDYIYSGNLKIKIFPNPNDVSCGKIIFWTPIGSECKRNEQIRLYVTDNKNNTTITTLNINIVPPPLNSSLDSETPKIVYERDEVRGTYKAFQAMGYSDTGLYAWDNETQVYINYINWNNLPDIEEAESILKNFYENKKDKVKGIWYVLNNSRYVMLNDGTYSSFEYTGQPEEEYYLVTQVYRFTIPQ